MLFRIIVTFMVFAGLAYYFNVDVRVLVEQSGVPEWLSSKGLQVEKSTTTQIVSQ